MTKNLVIVESPAKAKTIEKYLGKDFSVLASYGHVCDLPAKKDDFYDLPTFSLPSENSIRVVTRLEQAKLTKPALQFLMRLMHTGMLSSEQFEHVMNLVMDSNMRFVSVEEVKFIIHQVLSESLSHKEILMLEFAYDVETSPVTMH